LKRETNIFQKKIAIVLASFFIIVVFFALIFGDHGFIELLSARKELRQLQQSVASLEMERDQLAAEVEFYRDQPLAVEEIARRDLWLMKQNERVIVIVEDSKKN
jgi:cell division protein FtsB